MSNWLSEQEMKELTGAEAEAYSGPIPTQVVSNGEFNPIPQTRRQKQVEERMAEIGDEVGRKLGMYLRRRLRVRHEGERRNVFLRYLGEVATAVSEINKVDRKQLYDQLLKVAQKKTAEADVKLDSRGRPIDEEELELGDNVLIVDPADHERHIRRVTQCDREEDE